MACFVALGAALAPPKDQEGQSQKTQQEKQKAEKPAENAGKFWKRPQVKERLKLTDEQVAKLTATDEKLAADAKSNQQALREKRKALNEALSASEIDEAKIKALAAEVTELQGKTTQNMIDRRLMTRKVLTADQMKLIGEMRAEHQNRSDDDSSMKTQDAEKTKKQGMEMKKAGEKGKKKSSRFDPDDVEKKKSDDSGSKSTDN